MRTQLYFYLCLSFLCTGIAKAQTIKIGVIEYPPHINFNQNVRKDKAYRYVDKILKGLYADVEFKTYSNEKALAELDRGAIDLLFPLDVSQNKLRHLSRPLFRTVPGLCFKKKNFIPVLSATHRLKGLNIGVSAGTQVLPIVAASGGQLKVLGAKETLNKGIERLLIGEFDAFYHPSPMQVYHQKNPLSKKVACSKFYGYPSGVYIAVKANMDDDTFEAIDNAFSHALEIKSYEDYFWERR
ncbi:MAG: hypothetical protein ACI8WB_003288 [Phenylobacterium sp.]|jgi:hypothetical protein